MILNRYRMRAIRVSNNIIKTYGLTKFVNLIIAFQNNVSGDSLSKEYEVSRQRIHQWKQALGETQTIFVPSKEVSNLLAKGNRVTV